MEEDLGSMGMAGFLPYSESLWHHGKRTSEVHSECHDDELGY